MLAFFDVQQTTENFVLSTSLFHNLVKIVYTVIWYFYPIWRQIIYNQFGTCQYDLDNRKQRYEGIWKDERWAKTRSPNLLLHTI